MSYRRERLAHDLTFRIAQILKQRVADPRLRQVTVVEVRPAADASFARVFYRTHGDREDVAGALDRAKPYIRRCLAERLSLRRVPELDFRYDPSEDHGARVDQILRELSEGSEDEPEDRPD